MVNNRRSELEIIAEILTLSKKGAKTTEILYRGYLNYSQLKQYIPYLIERNIIEEKNIKSAKGQSKVYVTTDRGQNLLLDINKTLSYLR